MSTVLDALEIRFEANLRGVTAALDEVAAGLGGLGEDGRNAGIALAAGLEAGMLAGIDRVRSAARALADAASGGLSQGGLRNAEDAGFEQKNAEGLSGIVGGAVNGAVSQLEVKVPLIVDGVKLGEAAIRGINQVTKNTGRHLLDI